MGAKTPRQELAVGVQATRLGETYHFPLQRGWPRSPATAGHGCSVTAGPMPSPSEHRWHQPLGNRGTVKPRPLGLLPLLSLLHPRDPLLGTWLKKLPGVPRTFWNNWVTYLPSCPFCLGEADRIMDLSLHVDLSVGNFELKVNSVLTKGNSCYPSLRMNQ